MASGAALLLVTLVAMLLRISTLFVLDDSRLWEAGDQTVYQELARNLLDEHRYISRLEGVRSWRPPLYPAFLAGVSLALGPDVRAVRMLQAFAGTATCLAAYGMVSTLYGKRRAAIGASLLVAASPLSIFYTYQLMTETVYTLLLALALLQLAVAHRNSSALHSALGGMLAGLASLCRPEALLLLPTLAAANLASGDLRSRKRLRCWLMAAIMLVLTVLPWTARNYRIHKAVVLVSTNGGINFFWGNNAEATGGYHIPSHVEPPLPHDLSEVAKDKEWYKRGLEFWRKHPQQAAALFCRKVRMFLAWPGLNPVFLLPWVCLVMLGAVGALACWKHPTMLRYIGAPVLVLLVATSLYVVQPRSTLAVVPFLAALGGCALDRLMELWATAHRHGGSLIEVQHKACATG